MVGKQNANNSKIRIGTGVIITVKSAELPLAITSTTEWFVGVMKIMLFS